MQQKVKNRWIEEYVYIIYTLIKWPYYINITQGDIYTG